MATGPSRQPHPENVPGDFYVVNGCCTRCGVPQQEAPDVFASAVNGPPHCVVAQQPRTPAEINQTLEAIRAAELSCIRYRGRDKGIIQRLKEMGEANQCDAPSTQCLTRGKPRSRPPRPG